MRMDLTEAKVVQRERSRRSRNPSNPVSSLLKVSVENSHRLLLIIARVHTRLMTRRAAESSHSSSMTWSNSSAGSLGDAIPVRMSSLEKAISTDVIVEAEEGILEHTQGHQSPFILLG